MNTPHALLGRATTNDIVLDEAGIAATSLLLLLGRERIYAAVLQDGAKKQGRLFTLREDRPLRMGPTSLWVRREALEAGPDTQESATFRDDTISVVTWKANGMRYHAQLPAERPVLLGRHANAAIVVDDEHVSSLHACLVRTGSRLLIVDLASANGVRVRNQRQAFTDLPRGRSFTAGETRFHFVSLHPAETVDALEALHQRDLAAAQRTTRDLGQHRAQLLKSLGNMMAQHEATLTELEEHSGWLGARISELQTQLLGSEETHAQLRDAHDQLQQQSADQQQELENLKQQNAELGGAVEDLTSRLQAAHDHGDSLRQTHGELQQRTDDWQMEMKSLRDQNDQLRDALTTFESQAETQEQQLAEREERLQQQTDKLRAQQQENDQLRDALTAFESQGETWEQRLAEREEKLQRQTDSLREQQDEYDRLMHAQLETQAELEDRERILRSTEVELTKKELTLLAQRTELRKQQQAFARQWEKRPRTPDDVNLPGPPQRSEDDSIASPHFAKMLTEAIASHDGEEDILEAD